MQQIIPVILCGGSGTRLWPLSRKATPKQFLKLMGNDSLLQETARRTLDILSVSGDNLVIITLRDFREETCRQLEEVSSGLTRHVLCEPQARNTSAAVALAINYITQEFGEDHYIWILPADHYVGDEICLKESVYKATEIVEHDYMITFGIEPTRAETGYGYIHKEKTINDSGVYRVQKFVEKPDRETAEKLVSSGEYLWSSGMHFFSARAGKANFLRHAPETWDLVCQSIHETSDCRYPSLLSYSKTKEEPFETAVIEKTDRIAVIPCNPQWSDIGSWESLWEIKPKDQNGNALDGNVFCHGTTNSMILAQNRLVTCVGMKDVIIIETGDSILVADKSSNQSLKILVQTLQTMKRQETVFSHGVNHIWGSSRLIADTPDIILREINIKPGKIMIHHPSITQDQSQWLVASGQAVFIINGIKREIRKNETCNIPANIPFNISNASDEILCLYELQSKTTERNDTVDISNMPIHEPEPAGSPLVA